MAGQCEVLAVCIHASSVGGSLHCLSKLVTGHHVWFRMKPSFLLNYQGTVRSLLLM
jgi:hypothetical protein